MAKLSYGAWQASMVRIMEKIGAAPPRLPEIVADILRDHDAAMKLSEIIDQVSVRELIDKGDDLRNAVSNAVRELCEKDIVSKLDYGTYIIKKKGAHKNG